MPLLELSPEDRHKALQRLASYPPLDEAGRETVETLLKTASYGSARPGTILLEEGAPGGPIFFLLSGVVRIFHTKSHGREFTPKMMRAPNHFGELDLLTSQHVLRQSVEVVSDAMLASVDYRVLIKLLKSDHEFCFGWMKALARQFLFTIDASRHYAFMGLSGRIANYLLSYADAFGTTHGTRVEVTKHLSRNDLALQVGSTKRAVLRVIQQFEAKGLIETFQEGFVIHDVESLRSSTLVGRLGLLHELDESE